MCNSVYSILSFPISHADFADFTMEGLLIEPPDVLTRQTFSVLIFDDYILEPQEYLEVSLSGPDVKLPEPFQPKNGGDNCNLQLANAIDKPDDDKMALRLASTVIVIYGGNI